LDLGLDAIIVTTPPMHHHSAAIPFLSKGIHALIEKPLTSFTWQARAILDAAKSGGAMVSTCCQREFLPPVQRVKRAIADGSLGKLVSCHARINGHREDAYYQPPPGGVAWRGMLEHGDGLLSNQAPHHTDLMRFFMGPFAAVSATVANLIHPSITAEDAAYGHVHFAEGGIGSFHYSNAEAPGFYAGITVTDGKGKTVEIQTDARMFVAGSGGMAHIPCINQWTDVDAATLAEWNKEDADAFQQSEKPTMQYHLLAIRDFVEAIAAGRPPLIDGEAGLQTVMFVDACYLSNASNGTAIAIPLGEVAPDDLCGRDKILRLGS
jgi:UDP-N-acetyl-2-amino-2-deoxyglucuronate dehydrogenase